LFAERLNIECALDERELNDHGAFAFYWNHIRCPPTMRMIYVWQMQFSLRFIIFKKKHDAYLRIGNPKLYQRHS